MASKPLKNDLKGKRFGRLMPIEYIKKGVWECSCDCGAITLQPSGAMLAGRVVSCGCHKNEMAKLNATHRMSKTRVYKVWANMKARCHRPTSSDYGNYGARGIRVCERWHKFENFYADMGDPNGMTLDRIDVNGDYEPGNCRWVSRTVQGRNKRNTVTLTYAGKTLCITEWAEVMGIDEATIRRRIGLGWSHEKALTKPIGLQSNRKQTHAN